ncbi:MAG: hypothetical protein COA42_15465 [Alteromonadaceae bacterium]|nr:MAG: hypothetical protein COA42_15465 [Alteromonadaceae bacterium]
MQRYLHHPLVAAVLAMFVYGAWAAAVNADHGFTVALRSGLGQGVYAFVATFGVGFLAIKTYQHFGRGVLGFFLGFVFSFALMLAIPLSVHTILATPDKWAAMSLGLVWGTLYLLWLLWMESRRGETVL